MGAIARMITAGTLGMSIAHVAMQLPVQERGGIRRELLEVPGLGSSSRVGVGEAVKQVRQKTKFSGECGDAVGLAEAECRASGVNQLGITWISLVLFGHCLSRGCSRCRVYTNA